MSARSASRRARRRRLVAEPLEDRRLLAATPLSELFSAHGHDHGHEDHADHEFGSLLGSTSLPERTKTHVIDGVSHLFTWEPAPPTEAGPAVAGPATASAVVAAALQPLSSIPVLNSLAGAAASLYLDFNGHFQATWGAYSNATTPAYDVDGDQTTFSDQELANISAIWERVAEDFAPFKINVTTVEPSTLASGAAESAANGKAFRVAIGGSSSDWLGMSYGGYAYINSFTSTIANVAYVFAGGSNNIGWIGDSVSHEAGHGFGLQHQSTYDANGVKTQEYNPGDQTWGPLMGSSSTRYIASLNNDQMTTWHNGTSTLGPTSLQDDIALISRSQNVFGFRADDHANTTAGATVLSGSGTSRTGSGIVGANGDVDWFSFDLAQAASVRISVSGPEDVRNLDAAFELRDGAGQLIATVNPGDSYDASIVRHLSGRTYVGVKSSGAYGRLGQYTVTVAESLPAVTMTTSTAPFTTSESGRSESFTLVLESRPTANVTFHVASSDLGEGVPSTSAVVFTPDNWFTPRTVTIAGVNDGVTDGAATYRVEISAAESLDPNYNGLFDPADLTLVNLDAAPGQVYWIRSDLVNDVAVIQRSSLAGEGVETVLDITATMGPPPNGSYYNPSRLSIDPVGRKFYWIDASNKTVNHANVDGTAPQVLLTLANAPNGLTLDPIGGKLYWSDAVADKILRANLDGTGVEDVVATGLTAAGSLAVDGAGGKIYWADGFTMSRANLDGSGVETLITGDGVNRPGALALDLVAGKIYYSLRENFQLNKIFRSNLDGTDKEFVLDLNAIEGSVPNPVVQAIAIDHIGGRLHWTDSLNQKLYSADLDGSNVAALVEGGTSFRGIAVLPAVPGVVVTPRSGLTTTEAGGAATFTVALSTPPTANVVIPLSTGDATEGAVSATSLTFTPANWSLPQTVVVTGVDDALDDQDVAYAIVLGPAVSGDGNYSGLDAADVSLTNLDDDAPLFVDSFEVGEWNGLWVEDSQNDWFRSTQRATDGTRSAEVDGSATNATLTMAGAVNLAPYGSAELSFSWLIESSFDAGEYVAVDVFNGAWREVARISGNVDPENTWLHRTIELTGSDLVSNFKVRFRASVSGSDEDANVDNVRISHTSLAGPPNVLPVAVAGGAYTGVEGSPIVLNAGASTDSDGTIVGYEWDFDDDGQFDDATGATPMFVTTVDGVHPIRLRVTDNRGGTATAVTTATIANVGPTAAVGGPYAVNEGSAVTLSAAGSTDPGADIASYLWDLDNDGQFDDATGVSISFTRNDNGVYPVSVRVADDDGASSIASTQVTVANVAPTATLGGPYTAAPNVAITFSGGATDPGADVLTYEWDFTYDGVAFAADASGTNLTTPSFTYAADGSYTVALRVRDDDGGLSPIRTAAVTIASTPADALYFSVQNNATVGGVATANEDILALDAAGAVRVLFDGSDVGLTSATLADFDVVGPNEILLSFTTAISVPGVGTVDDSDIVRFIATSLGATTAGTFSMYFDGSDVGLTTSGEAIDAFHRLADGRLLISTAGSASVPGVSAAAQDLLLFTPTSTGANTAGSWSMYFDGSDVGLTTSNENVNALAVDAAGRLYLSTVGNFSVAGVSGANEDVLTFTPTSLGGTTAGTFSTALTFDGSAFGLSGNALFGIDLPNESAAQAALALAVDEWLGGIAEGPASSGRQAYRPPARDVFSGEIPTAPAWTIGRVATTAPSLLAQETPWSDDIDDALAEWDGLERLRPAL